jgi:glycerophosphoryl diester phosphodiesterase
LRLAHRGDPHFAENTVASVIESFNSGFDGAEIDVQLLADQRTWVLHHDLLPGRIVSGLPRQPLLAISPSQWRNAKVEDRERGTAAEPAAFLDDVLAEASANRGADGWLAIEIKGFPSRYAIERLVRQVAAALPPEAYSFTSLDEAVLRNLRSVGYGGYLGWVVLPPQAAARGLTSEERGFIQSYGSRFNVTLAGAEHVLQGGTRLMRDPSSATRLREALGPEFGIHLEWEMLDDAGLRETLRSQGITVFTYSADDDDRRQARYLGRMMRETGMPIAGVVLSGTATAFCEILVQAFGEDPAERQSRQVAPVPMPGANSPAAEVPDSIALSPGRERQEISLKRKK